MLTEQKKSQSTPLLSIKSQLALAPGTSRAAACWLRFGFSVIPIVPSSKQTALKWDPWLSELSAETIASHWFLHPDHDLGFIVGENVVVFDADCPEAIGTLTALEWEHGIYPILWSKRLGGNTTTSD